MDEYKANHRRIYRMRGAARSYSCVEGGDHQALDWAHVHDTDPADPMNYRPMCRSHHKRYDGLSERSMGNRYGAGTQYTAAQREAMSSRMKAAIASGARPQNLPGTTRSAEHREKIAAGVRSYWERRRNG